MAFDLVASRLRPRGTHAPHAIGLVALGDPSFLTRGNALSRLAQAGVVAMPSERRAAEALWAEVPPWVKALVFDRAARVVGWSPSASRGDREREGNIGTWVAASAFVGIALAAAASNRTLRGGAGGADGAVVDGGVVQREVAEALRAGVALDAGQAALVADSSERAQRAPSSKRLSRFPERQSSVKTTVSVSVAGLASSGGEADRSWPSRRRPLRYAQRL